MGPRVSSPFADGFTLHELALTLASESGGYGLPPAGAATVAVAVTLRVRSRQQPEALAGQAERDVLELEGRCVQPMTLPAGVGAGSTAALAVGGRWGTLTLEPELPSPIPEVEAALGQRITGTWRAP